MTYTVSGGTLNPNHSLMQNTIVTAAQLSLQQTYILLRILLSSVVGSCLKM